jgi:hypothetical protein
VSYMPCPSLDFNVLLIKCCEDLKWDLI